jgi:hypothetical protein
MILVAKSHCPSNHAHYSPTFTRKHDLGNDFATNISECDVLHYGVKSKQANAAVACSNGTYQGWGSYAVVFPPGYKPLFGSGSKYGNGLGYMKDNLCGKKFFCQSHKDKVRESTIVGELMVLRLYPR